MTKINQIKNELVKKDKDIVSLINMLMKTQFQALLDKLHQLEEERAKLESRLANIQNSTEILEVTEEQVRQAFKTIRKKLKSGDLKNKKQVIDTYVSKVIVYPERVEIHFNFFPSITLEMENEDTVDGDKKDCLGGQSFLQDIENSCCQASMLTTLAEKERHLDRQQNFLVIYIERSRNMKNALIIVFFTILLYHNESN